MAELTRLSLIFKDRTGVQAIFDGLRAPLQKAFLLVVFLIILKRVTPNIYPQSEY